MSKKQYIRDGRAPIPNKESTSKVMSANKDSDTKPEIMFRRLLWNKGLRGYRLHLKSVPGRPDVSYKRDKIAIFVNGCYWHRCPHCDLPLPKSNTEFWKNKFNKNKERDMRKSKKLQDQGWVVFTVWECQIKEQTDDLKRVINDIRALRG